MTHPPRVLERFVESTLPPSQRENILGDLEERYRSPGGGMSGYLLDAVHVIPRMAAKNFLLGFSCMRFRADAGADLRSRAAAYQDYFWTRNAGGVLAALIVIATAAVNLNWKLPDLGVFAMAIGWVCGTYQLYLRNGHANPIPCGISPDELRRFHRSELCRQMNVNWNLLLYWIVPAPLLLFTYGATFGPVRVMYSGLVLLAAITLQTFVTAVGRRHERAGIEKELFRLETEALGQVS